MSFNCLSQSYCTHLSCGTPTKLSPFTVKSWSPACKRPSYTRDNDAYQPRPHTMLPNSTTSCTRIRTKVQLLLFKLYLFLTSPLKIYEADTLHSKWSLKFSCHQNFTKHWLVSKDTTTFESCHSSTAELEISMAFSGQILTLLAWTIFN